MDCIRAPCNKVLTQKKSNTPRTFTALAWKSPKESSSSSPPTPPPFKKVRVAMLRDEGHVWFLGTITTKTKLLLPCPSKFSDKMGDFP